MGGFGKNALISGLGLGFHIAWSYFFWDGSLLMGDSGEAAGLASYAVIVHIAVAALCSFLVALLTVHLGSLCARPRLHAAFALLATASVLIAGFAGAEASAISLVLAGFALGGLGSMQRLAWEEYLSLRGVRCIAFSLPIAYFVACAVYMAISMLARPWALLAAAVLPLVSWGVMGLVSREFPSKGDLAMLEGGRDRCLFSALPPDGWRFIGVLTLIYFANGVMRPSAAAWQGGPLSLTPALITAFTAMPSMLALICAYVFYRRQPLLVFYLAFPLMAVFSLLPSVLDPYSAGFTFCVALVSMEFWFFIIGSIIKDGVSALMCVALLRCVQWAGGALGRLAVPFVFAPQDASTIVLLTLVFALLIMVGFMTLYRRHASEGPGASSDDADEASGVLMPLEHQVQVAADRFGLSPREQEVLVIWASGRTSAYIESRLFISKNTVKTHLRHIYAKTGTANRETLLQLLDHIDEGAK